MKFLIDAHLPPSLKKVFQQAGQDAIHTLDLPDQNASRDSLLNQVSMAEHRVVVTKDTDFYHSHLLQGRPWKLVLLRTGNMGLKETRRCLRSICQPSLKRSMSKPLLNSTGRGYLLLRKAAKKC
jgi:predicted nuclease of predicted toxin-antitoxin system